MLGGVGAGEGNLPGYPIRPEFPRTSRTRSSWFLVSALLPIPTVQLQTAACR